jgi:hypothetical protein
MGELGHIRTSDISALSPAAEVTSATRRARWLRYGNWAPVSGYAQGEKRRAWPSRGSRRFGQGEGPSRYNARSASDWPRRFLPSIA